MNPTAPEGSLLARLLELPVGARARFLRQAAKDNPSVAERWREFEVLLAHDAGDRPGGVRAPPVAALEAALEAAPVETAGSRIGRYKLIAEIGQGGFGVVWVAEQFEPVQRRVALKILKPGMDTREVVARFEAERQALALMDHPNIAHVLDGGATASGRPYFVMDLVRGTPITRYCDDQRVAPEERLRLFCAVCAGVQHAHQKGVIHRDLKPSNILVTLHDGIAVPKIIDFGIAKATSGFRLTTKTLYTQFHAFVGTPVYASPEQMEMSGVDVDTRSDIYSLGVLLYELLAGRPPFDAEALEKSGLDAMRRTIREREPPRPSTRLTTLGDEDRAAVARRRATDPARLVASLRGDLDWIVMRCLEKDRTRRYESASAVAADVERHLRHEPVQAHAPSARYRARKFVRRHRVGVAAIAAVFVTLLAGLASSNILLVRERNALARATASERAELKLRQEAERGREAEAVHASRTARDLAEQLLASGRSSEGLAWLVYAARKNPRDATIAARLASCLASRHFLLPLNPPLRFPSAVKNVQYCDGGRKLGAYCDDGTIGVIDTRTGADLRVKLPSGLTASGVLFCGDLAFIRGLDDVVRVFDPVRAELRPEFRFDGQIARLSVRRPADPLLIVALADGRILVTNTTGGESRTLPVRITESTVAILSDDGRWLGLANPALREAEMWDTSTGRRTARTLLLNEIFAAAFSPDSRHLVLVSLRDQQFGFVVRAVPELTVEVPWVALPEHIGGSAQVVTTFSPDGRLFAITSQYGGRLYELATGTPIGPHFTAGFHNVAMPADVFRLLTAIERRSGTRGTLFRIAGGRLQTLAPSGHDAVRNWTVRDALTGDAVLPPLAHPGGVVEVRLSADSRTLLGCGDGVLLLWDLATGRLVAEPLPLPPWPDFDVALAPDATELVIASADGSVARLRVTGDTAHALVLPRAQSPMPAAFLPEAPARVFLPRADHAVVLDVASARTTRTITFTEVVPGLGRSQLDVAIRDDLRFMVVHATSGAWQSWPLGVAVARPVATLEAAPAAASWAFFSPASDHVAIATNQPIPSVGVWDLTTGRAEGTLIKPDWPMMMGNLLRPACFTPDGRLLVVATFGGSVHVWDWRTGRSLAELRSDRAGMTSFVDASRDGRRFVTGNRWGEAHLWDAATSRRVGEALYGSQCVFSATGDRVLTSMGNAARVWDSRTAAPVSAPMVHPGVGIRAVAFSPDARRVVTAAGDSTARIWDALTGLPVSEPLVHDSRVVNCAFSPDGRYVRTEEAGTDSGSLFRVWSVPPDSPVIPEWLLELATLCAGTTIDANGRCVRAPAALAQIDQVRRTIAALADDAPFVEWGRWILANSAQRSIGPGFTATPARAAEAAAEFMR